MEHCIPHLAIRFRQICRRKLSSDFDQWSSGTQATVACFGGPDVDCWLRQDLFVQAGTSGWAMPV